MTQSSGNSTVPEFGIITAAMKRLSHPSRVTTSVKPRTEQAIASDSGTSGMTLLARMPKATPTKTIGKIRPPLKPEVAAIRTPTILTTRISAMAATV